MVERSPRCASAWSISRARNCIARSLNASVGPWNSSSTKRVGAKLRQRRDRRMTERAVGVVRHAREVGIRDRAADERAHDLAGDFGIGPAGKRGDLLRRENTGQDSGT